MNINQIRLVLGSVLLAGCILIGLKLVPLKAQESSVELPPMWVTYKRELFDANGRLRWSRAYTVARNRSGSLSETYIHNDSDQNQNFEAHTVIDQEARTTTGFFPVVRLKTTMPLSGPRVPQIAGPCDGPEQKTLLGFTLVSAKNEFTTPAGGGITVKTIAWRAKELGCFEVMREIISSKSDGGSASRDIVTPITISRGDPPAEWFAVPQDYIEAKPSEIMKAVSATVGIKCPTCALNTAYEADKRYEKRNAKQ